MEPNLKYYLDTEFDGHNGPLLSVGIVREDGFSLHLWTEATPKDGWVQEHVEPHMDSHEADLDARSVRPNAVGGLLLDFLRGDYDPYIFTDSPVDIWRFCRAISTADDGGWASVDIPNITFEACDVSCYPTDLPGAVQHNAWWDAMALRHKLTNN